MPCSDGDAMACERTHQSSNSSTPHSGQSDKDHMDLCSPFCQCSCCAIAYALPIPAIEQALPLKDFGTELFFAHYQQRPIRISLPIWQPPQLV